MTLKGDSHVRIAKPAPERSDRDIDSVRIQSFGDTGTLTFVGYPNDAGCLGKIEVVDIRADSFQDAETKAYRALSSYLNLASTALDVPLRVFQVESVELRTEGRRNSFLNPYQEVFLSIPIKEPITPEFAGYSFLYREALNTNSPIYQFLCFYKILEGIDKRRARLAVKAKSEGQSFSRPREVIPAKPQHFVAWLELIYPGRRSWDEMALESIFLKDVLGKKVNYVVDHELRGVRNRIAHALTSEQEEPDMGRDETYFIDVLNWMPLVRCLARLRLRNEFPEQFAA